MAEIKENKMVENNNLFRKTAIALPVIAGACWGIAGMFLRIMSDAGFDTPTVIFTRCAMCVLITFIFIAVTDIGQLKVRIRDLPMIAVNGLFGFAFLMLAYNMSVQMVSLSMASVLLCTAPIFVVFISVALFKEKLTFVKVLCMAAAFIGCAMLSGIFEGGGINWNITGILWGIAAAVFNSIYILSAKAVAKAGYSSFTICLYSAMAAVIVLAPFADYHVITEFVRMQPIRGVGFLVIQTLVTSLIPSLAYITAMKYVDVGKSAILEAGAEPVAALLAGIIVYAEIPTLIGSAGMAVTVIALMVLTWEDVKQKK